MRIISGSDRSRRFPSKQIKRMTFAVTGMISGWRTREDVRFMAGKPKSRQGFQLCFTTAAQHYTLYCASPAFSKTRSSSSWRYELVENHKPFLQKFLFVGFYNRTMEHFGLEETLSILQFHNPILPWAGNVSCISTR